MENGELCVIEALIAVQLQLSVINLAWHFKIFIIQSLDQLVAEFGWKMFSAMEMNSPYLTVHTMDGVMLQIVFIMMMLELLVEVRM